MLEYKAIFWDFDGVIKDSVEIKSDAFEQLFSPFGNKVATRIRKHHEKNGGMSRFDKLPIYLEWVGEVLSIELLDEYARKFSQLVKQKVINSVWVVGILDYLDKNHSHQDFFLITATPQKEIEEIVLALKINNYFKAVVGAPTRKCDAMKQLLDEYKIKPEKTIMIGDSISDYNAALVNKIPFILRRTNLNKTLQKQLNTKMIDDFS